MNEASANGRKDTPALLFARLRDWFDRDGWQYEVRENALVSAFGGENGEWPLAAEVRGHGMIVVMSMAPFDIAIDRRNAVMEAITRANCGLAIGGFDFDIDNGIVQFRTGLDVEESEQSLTDVIIRHLVYQNAVAMDRYFPALRAVIEGSEPEAEIDKAEGRF